jgi:hypothetical protein
MPRPYTATAARRSGRSGRRRYCDPRQRHVLDRHSEATPRTFPPRRHRPLRHKSSRSRRDCRFSPRSRGIKTTYPAFTNGAASSQSPPPNAHPPCRKTTAAASPLPSARPRASLSAPAFPTEGDVADAGWRRIVLERLRGGAMAQKRYLKRLSRGRKIAPAAATFPRHAAAPAAGHGECGQKESRGQRGSGKREGVVGRMCAPVIVKGSKGFRSRRCPGHSRPDPAGVEGAKLSCQRGCRDRFAAAGILTGP